MLRARPLRALAATVAATAAALVALAPADQAAAAPACTKFAASAGSDSAAGTQSAPYRTVQKLADSLGAGQVGCLAAGETFGGVKITRDGITLTSAPGGAKATVRGSLWVTDAADDVTIENLVLDGSGTSARVSFDTQGDRTRFLGNDITNRNTAICLHVGSNIGSGIAYDVVIDGNRIFDCGRMPATGFDHGIYVNHAYDTRITNNLIYDNADYGVHLYPGANRTYVANNVIDGNGRGITFSSEGSLTSSDNVAENNIISNSLQTTNVESWWGGPVGRNNVARANCLWNGRKGNYSLSNGGFTLSGNIEKDPLFANRGAKDFSLRAGSPCVGKGPQASAAPAPPPSFRELPPAAPSPAPAAPKERSLQRDMGLGDRAMSQPLTPKQRQVGALARPTLRQLTVNRRAVVRLSVKVRQLERRVLRRSSTRIPAALRTPARRVTPAQMRAARIAAVSSLRRVTVVLNALRASDLRVPAVRVPRRVRPTVAQMRVTEKLARVTLRRAELADRILARRA
ncbi:right-handed parallel beta-helix repeat-containing protein [Miltoncostaea marina]|uniref:right-handed parallel beta-helix repeat-containing protein n=1 Tax=Miltoncostaea marina TaxID=2843215 RepID=UPI001C3C9DF0|nr:right-handed parallel beta-helix repeat-containing protein [Miltoncostaea marina]